MSSWNPNEPPPGPDLHEAAAALARQIGLVRFDTGALVREIEAVEPDATRAWPLIEARLRTAAEEQRTAIESLRNTDLSDAADTIVTARADIVEQMDPAHRARRAEAESQDPSAETRGKIGSLVHHLQIEVRRAIRACTPSVLLDQPFPADPLGSDVSVSYEVLGVPNAGTEVFGAINKVVAEIYGATRAWSLVNGSSGANWTIALYLSRVLHEDDIVLVGRGSHISVPRALTDLGTRWRYLDADYLPEFEAVLPPSAEQVAAGLAEHGEHVKAVWVNGPSYEGVLPDTRSIVDAMGGADRSVLLIVDEAWGSHLPVCPDLAPHAALANGADIVNSSTHKQAGGLQGTAVLTAKESARVDLDAVNSAVTSMYSTSPSFLLLASIESTYGMLLQDRTNGHRIMNDLVARARRLAEQLRLHLPGVRLFEDLPEVKDCVLDPMKVTLDLSPYPENGFDLTTRLANGDRQKTGTVVVVEKQGVNTLTLLVTHQMTHDDIDTLAQRVAAAILEKPAAGAPIRKPPPSPFGLASEQHVEPRDVKRLATESVPMTAAAGRVAAEIVAVYPPGVPVLTEGLVITEDHIGFISEVKSLGGHIFQSAPSQKDAGTVRVVR